MCEAFSLAAIYMLFTIYFLRCDGVISDAPGLYLYSANCRSYYDTLARATLSRFYAKLVCDKAWLANLGIFAAVAYQLNALGQL